MKRVGLSLFGLLLCVSLAFGAEVNFQWGASTGDVDGYRIYHGEVVGGPYPEQLCEVNATTLNYKASLNEDQEYYLICRAFNSYGESGDSNEVHWCYVLPGPPENLRWSINLVDVMENMGAGRIKFVSKK
jgi:hypothetical protein